LIKRVASAAEHLVIIFEVWAGTDRGFLLKRQRGGLEEISWET
jgi:hypothetical protein